MITTSGVDHPRQVHFQAKMKRPHRFKPEQPLFQPLLQVDSDRGYVADDLAGGFLKRNVEAPLAPAAGGLSKGRRHTRLAGTSGARQENAAPTVESLAPQHGVETLDAGRNALVRRGVFEGRRSDRPDRDPVLLDEKRIFVGAVDGAAIFATRMRRVVTWSTTR
jgi:hypothetical protein